jgi:DNA-directed RNA polymerase subunit RPC12/RpoP
MSEHGTTQLWCVDQHHEWREAENGFLCWDHWLKLKDGMLRITDLVTHMRSIRTNSSFNVGQVASSGFGPRWPLSDSRVTASAVYAAMATCAISYASTQGVDEPEWPAADVADIFGGFSTHASIEQVYWATRDLALWLEPKLELLIANEAGARYAAELRAALFHAHKNFTMVEDEHHIPILRCAKCSHAQLRWKPPITEKDDVKITCERCGHRHTHKWYDDYLLELANRRQQTY